MMLGRATLTIRLSHGKAEGGVFLASAVWKASSSSSPSSSTRCRRGHLLGKRGFFSSSSGRHRHEHHESSSSSSSSHQHFRDAKSGKGGASFRHAMRDEGLKHTSVLSNPQEVEGPEELPSRAEQLRRLREGEEYDVVIVGGGATGAGCALDAATRGLKIACIERGDFSSETSSRSTKLIWAGIKYFATATASLLSTRLLTNPIATIRDFRSEVKLVINCHRERRYMMEKQGHLCNWVPIAMPFYTWHVSPPPFGHPLFGFFPLLAPLVLKVYDSMSGFSCPPSYILSPKRARELFPQLAPTTTTATTLKKTSDGISGSNHNLKYCAVFYEAQHNDARTNLAIALTAARHGAHIANYVEMVDTIRDTTSHKGGKVTGIRVVDRMSGETFEIRAKKVVLAGGPFTDQLRQMEETGDIQPAVRGASGTHIVLPGHFCPRDIGLLDYNTSDGRFLFFLPWQGHTLVGTTDTKNKAETLPKPPEEEVQWILKECVKYLRPDLKVRRSDVLSAWRGWRPLAVDPHLPPGAPVSRDHIISKNPETGVIFIAGGKWTTWREMAQEVIDVVVGKDGPKCKTLDVTLWGGEEGYSNNLSSELMKKHGLPQDIAEHLAKTYGARAWEVCQYLTPGSMGRQQQRQLTRSGASRLVPNYPYIDAEVVYACREYAVTVEDILSRRTRLAFLNKDAARDAIPVVTDIMTCELGWDRIAQAQQFAAAQCYVDSYAGRVPQDEAAKLQDSTYARAPEVFRTFDKKGAGSVDLADLAQIAEILGCPMKADDLSKTIAQMDNDGNGQVTTESFESWWNEDRKNPFRVWLATELKVEQVQ